jgi:LytS/YehU family sensor histidine kinase
MSASRSPAAEYLQFLVWAVAIGVAAALLGYAPTRRLGGEGALPAMIAGIVIGVIASAVGAVPTLLARRSGAAPSPVQGLLSTAIRLAVLVVLGVSVGLSGAFEARPLIVWIGLGYAAQLALDVRYAVRGV